MTQTKTQTKTLRRLLPALEAVKERDAAAFRAKREQAEALRAEIRRLKEEIAASAAALDPSDLAGHDAYLRYREASLARIVAIEAMLAPAAEQEQAARGKLARSHGSVEGCALLADRADREAALKASKSQQ